MKKQYETPNAKKVEFDYTETVVASGQTKQSTDTKCPTPCGQSTQVKSPGWWYGRKYSCIQFGIK